MAANAPSDAASNDWQSMFARYRRPDSGRYSMFALADMVKPHGLLVLVSSAYRYASTPSLLPGHLPGPFRGLTAWEISSWGVFHA